MEKGIQDLIDSLGKLSLIRESMTVMIIVHSEVGLEILGNTHDLVIRIGMLDVTRMTLIEAQAKLNELREEECRRAGEHTMSAFRKDPGQPN